MALLKFSSEIPPGGLKYLQKETRAMIVGDSPNNIVDLVIAHRRYKKLEPTDRETVWLEIQRQICSRLSERQCYAEGAEDEWVPIKEQETAVDYSMIVGFSRAAIEWIGSGREVVSEKEAQRRASICFTCPLNQRSEGCLPCSILYGMIEKAIPKHRQIEGLEICSSCKCSLKAKVHLPMNVIEESNRGRDIQPVAWCWQNPASANFQK